MDLSSGPRSVDNAGGETLAGRARRPLTTENDVVAALDDNVPLLVGPVLDLKLDLQSAILLRQFELVRAATAARTGLDDIGVLGGDGRNHREDKEEGQENAEEGVREGGGDLHGNGRGD